MGGSEAELDAGDVAAGILNVADALNMEQTGCFIQWNGNQRKF
jgi:hypothetical protein